MAKSGHKKAKSALPAQPAPVKDQLRAPSRRRASREPVEIEGLVADLFGRRFTLEADGARHLVDLGRRGGALVRLTAHTRITVIGRRKDGEVKAWLVRDADGRAHALRKEKRVGKLTTSAPAVAPPPQP
jgi:hypothetical protein